LRGGAGRLLSFAASSDESFFSLACLLMSTEDPGVLGVLPALPKLAKAPLPSPNADEAPALVGEATAAVEMLPTELKGLFFPWPPNVPNRLLPGPESALSLRSVLFVVRLSLLLLLIACYVSQELAEDSA
jgi:hypothetical protein